MCEKCRKEIRKDSNRTDGVRKEYRTTRWQKERLRCLERFDYVDLYALYRSGQIITADRVHHIEEILEAPDKFHIASNHFPVSDMSHHEIHDRYKKEDKQAVQEELRGFMKRWEEENHF